MADKLMKSLNAYSGLWTLVVVLIVCVLFFFNVQTSLSALEKQHAEVTIIHSKQIEVLDRINDSLEDLNTVNNRDHANILSQQVQTNKLISKSERTLDRLVFIMDRLEKRLNK